MPCDYSKYPTSWKTEIRPRILARAGNKCERCGIDNGREGWRLKSGNFYTVEDIAGGYMPSDDENELEKALKRPPFKIVLTIAHIDNPDPMDCRDENLQALCQRCHNKLDGPMRRANAQQTINSKKGIQPLF